MIISENKQIHDRNAASYYSIIYLCNAELVNRLNIHNVFFIYLFNENGKILGQRQLTMKNDITHLTNHIPTKDDLVFSVDT